MVMGKCDACGKGRVPHFLVKHGKVTRLPGQHTSCLIPSMTIKIPR